MVLPAIACLIIFSYAPMPGIQIAFKDYKFNSGIWGSPWAGLKYVHEFLADPYIWRALRNTLAMGAINLLLFYPLPIVFSLMVGELRSLRMKRVIQTVSYFPHFISWVIVAVMAGTWLSPFNGIVNDFLLRLNAISKPIYFLGEANLFWWVAFGLTIWKAIGWNSIIYIASIAGVDPGMYEAAYMDGAGRLQRIWYITLPAIKSTIVILLILNIGSLLGGGNFEISYLLGNPLTIENSEILDTYILKVGLSLGRYSYATAVGVSLSVLSLLLLLGSNWISRKITGESFM